jgi:hypothetical protein
VPRTLTNCLDSGLERVDQIGHLCSDRWRRTVPFHCEESSYVVPANCIEP